MNMNTRAFGLSLLVPFLGLSFLLAGCSDEAASEQTPPGLSAEIQAELQAALDGAVEVDAPGAALYVSGPEGTWSGAAGVSNLDAAEPMAPGDRFRAGSMMKLLVAAAVLRSVEEGAVALDDTLSEVLPELASRIDHADSIDVAMLLSHRSGIPDWITPVVRDTLVTDPAHVWSAQQVLDMIDGLDPLFEPGVAFSYSNTNYILLGEILTAVEGKSWREIVRERVIEPARLQSTEVPDPGDPSCSGCARGYIAMEGILLDATEVDPSMAGSSGGHALVTTPADLTRLLDALREGDLFERAATRDAMFDFQSTPDGVGDTVGGHLTGYGFGMMQLDTAGAIGHLGITAGYTGFTLYFPDTERYVAGYMNQIGDPGVLAIPVVEALGTR
jgi:D-alanyl-D-alanine carboxypeptidase